MAVRVSEVSAGRDNNFDFLRFACATLVVFSHGFALLFGMGNSAHPDWLAALTRRQIHGGSLAVDGFFAMSGFLVTASWLRSRGARDYLRKRAL